MTTDTNGGKYVWKSGDWKVHPRKNVPYNGVKIIGTPAYDTNDNFVSAEVVIKDFTFAIDGVSSTIESLTVEDDWVEIPSPKPESPPSGSPPVGAKFSVKGKFKLRKSTSEVLLRVRFDYGLEGQRREELGFVMGLPATRKE